MPSKERREARLQAGLCSACGVEPHEPDRTKCAGCLAYAAQLAADTRADRVARGVCDACGKRRAKRGRGGRCSACADKYLAKQLAREMAARRTARTG